MERQDVNMQCTKTHGLISVVSAIFATIYSNKETPYSQIEKENNIDNDIVWKIAEVKRTF